jgi:hypothetical protein
VRQKVDNPVYMSANDIEKEYDGKWVFITNAEYSPHMKFLGGIPVVVADNIFEDQADGFYDEFKDKKYAPRTDMDYTNAPELLNAFFCMLGTDDS